MENQKEIMDFFTDAPYCEPTDEELQRRSNILYKKLESLERKQNSILADIKKAKSLLPIFQKRLFFNVYITRFLNLCCTLHPLLSFLITGMISLPPFFILN